MTPEQFREAAAVMLAAADGKPIQMLNRFKNEWFDVETPMFDGKIWEYRIKPEPRKVKVRLYKHRNTRETIYAFVEGLASISAYIPISDIVEIEVKD